MIIFMGVAGSGKSVQGRMLADELALPWLSTGEFLRMLVSGERRKDMLAGRLLSDREIIKLVQKIFAMIDVHEEFILDGFPRTVSQADWLLNQHKHGQLDVTAVIHLTVDQQTVLDRLLKRGRQDDHKEAILERFREYEEVTRPILDHFREARVPIFDVDGAGDIEAIHGQIKKDISSVN
ncbi:MAG TPA: nucleoside monophosphate kinase [Verrucomicrobiae bacterium]|nr:nucleoside monophosphate kinase [Verrucomicrobiae bacterium]